MYNVSLVNLAADARTAADSLVTIERPGLTGVELRTLLQAFGEIDAVENAVAAPEIRVKVRNENHLIRTGQKKFMLYDVAHRELPAHVLTLDEVMAELDGSAPAARSATVIQHQVAALEQPASLPLPASPVAQVSKPRVFGLSAVALILLGAIVYLAMPVAKETAPAGFVPVASTELAALQDSLAGVYLTGNEPGQHGIVLTGPGELKLFVLEASDAPRVVYVSYRLGRVDSKLSLATDQPGGAIEVRADGALVYCGEVYVRIP